MSHCTNFSEALNKDYSPSLWSKRYPASQVVDKHVEAVTKASENVQRNIPHLSNVKYGDKESWVMDIYGTTLPQGSPILVYIHGGYWQDLNKDISSYLVEPFYKAGIKIVVPGYDLAPTVTLQEIVEQIKAMARGILKEAARNGTRSVWFGGHSAGAHLAASLLVDSKWYNLLDKNEQAILKGFFLISGIFDLSPLIHTEYNEALNLNSSSANTLSPIKKDLKWITQKDVKFSVLLAVAENDSPAFRQQTSDFNEFLKLHKIKTEYIFLKELDHFDIVEKLGEIGYILTEKIISNIKSH